MEYTNDFILDQYSIYVERHIELQGIDSAPESFAEFKQRLY